MDNLQYTISKLSAPGKTSLLFEFLRNIRSTFSRLTDSDVDGACTTMTDVFSTFINDYTLADTCIVSINKKDMNLTPSQLQRFSGFSGHEIILFKEYNLYGDLTAKQLGYQTFILFSKFNLPHVYGSLNSAVYHSPRIKKSEYSDLQINGRTLNILYNIYETCLNSAFQSVKLDMTKL